MEARISLADESQNETEDVSVGSDNPDWVSE